MGRKIFPYTHMRGDQARPHQSHQLRLLPRQSHQLCVLPRRGRQLHLLPRRGHQLILFSLLSSAHCLQLTVSSLLSPAYCLQLTVFSLLCPRCSRQVWGEAIDFTTRLSLMNKVDNLVMSVAFCFVMG